MVKRIISMLIILMMVLMVVSVGDPVTSVPGMDTDLSTANASFIGEGVDDNSSWSVAGAGDVNGDGYDDILIGARENDDGGVDAGQTYLIFGKAGGWSMDTDLSNADASFWGEDAGDQSGWSAAGAGDVNGDGYDDILIGARHNDEGGSGAGQTYLILGKAGGWSMDTDLSNADASFWGENTNDDSGRSVAGAGDVNSDGYDDILIGATYNSDGGHNAGQTYLILGKAAGWSMDTNLSDADASFWGESEDDQSGCSVAGAGDVNDDGYDDLLIGAIGAYVGGDYFAGQTYLILGKAAGWSMDTDLSNVDASFWGEGEYDFSGVSVAGAGDVNGDGYDDILIGAITNDDGGDYAGQTYLILGKAAGWSMDTDLSNVDASFWGENQSDWSGGVAGAGDVNGDGYDDFLIGAPRNDEAGSNAGQAYLILGKATGWRMDTGLSRADASFLGENAGDGSGPVAGAGDVNGDGCDDILIGAPYNDEGGSDAGQAYLVFYLIGDPPVWGGLPSLEAVEDVPVTYDFSAYVSDPDSPILDLEITSVSPFVTAVHGLNVTFLFPNGVSEVSVPLVLTDGDFKALATVDFTIQPVNDPPEHDIQFHLSAFEDEPSTIDLAFHVWDIDNPMEDLSLLVDTPYATADGLNLTVVFPDGVLEYDLWFNVSDGLDLTEAMIHFTVTPVDDPPVIADLEDFTAIEDNISVLNLTNYLYDIDTPVEDLYVEISDTTYCTVVGQELHFLYTIGGNDHHLMVTVRDELSHGSAELVVHVQEVNDAPIVTTPPPLLAIEEETAMMDLAEYVTDEETAWNQLVIECEHPAVVGIEGQTITLLYTTWENPHSIQFSVFDGLHRTDGSFDVQVQAVNDPPEINFIPLPLIEVPEDETYTLALTGEDEEGDELTWSDDTDLFDISPTNGTIRFTPTQSEVGEWWVNITVEDSEGLMDEVLIRFFVLNVNDAPVITSLSPEDGAKYKQGKTVTFSVVATDEEGDDLTVTWTSDGVTIGTGETLDYKKLKPGTRTIKVTVSDGETSVEDEFTVVITKEEESPALGGAFVLLAMLVGMAALMMRRKG